MIDSRKSTLVNLCCKSSLMKSYLLIGSGVKFNSNQLQKTYKKNDNILVIYNKEGQDLDCSKINLPNNAQVFINAHGSKTSSNHTIKLCSCQRNLEMSPFFLCSAI